MHKGRPAAPLIVIHGGPSLPSEYLTSLAQHITNRTIIFYDQLGCGWSSIPQQNEWYGVVNMSLDLGELIKHLQDVWKVEKFHLLGHSLGGAIGYEFLLSNIQDGGGGSIPQCLSFILSNASTNFELSSSEQTRLFTEYNLQLLQTQMPPKQTKHQTKKLSIHDQFFQTHICRTSTKPVDLVSALSRRGKDWSANDYSVSSVSEIAVSGDTFPPVLIIRGQYDFVTEACTQGWNDIFASHMKNSNCGLQEVVLEDCAHYPHFEQPENYSQCIDEFCSTAESV